MPRQPTRNCHTLALALRRAGLSALLVDQRNALLRTAGLLPPFRRRLQMQISGLARRASADLDPARGGDPAAARATPVA